METPHRNPFKIPLIISAIITSFLCVFLIYVATFSPDAIDSRNHVPESGAEVVVAAILLAPIIAVLSIVTFYLAKAYVKRKKKISNELPIAAGNTQNNVPNDSANTQSP